MTNEIVRVKSAPGLAWKKRRNDVFEARWQAKQSSIDKGWKVKSVKLWSGTTDPTPEEWRRIADTCRELQQELLVWEKGGLPAAVQFDGTLGGLMRAYRADADSNYKKLRYKTRVHYDDLMRLIDKQYGTEHLSNLKGRTFLRWHEEWKKGGTAVAHGKVGILRTLFGFGKTMLEEPECRRLAEILHDMKFEMPKARTQRLEAHQADAVRAMAHKKGRPSIALAQAFQFEGMLRQKDVIGEWVPLQEDGHTDITFIDATEGIYQKWLRGIRWNEIDANFILKHVTSKRQKEITINLRYAPMIMDEFCTQFGLDRTQPDRGKLPSSGPIIVSEWSALPWTAVEYRRWWRICADACGIPREVKNMDSRAGAISEATDAGAQLEDVRHAATHSNISMTQRYSRGAEEKTAKVMQLRVKHRTKNEE